MGSSCKMADKRAGWGDSSLDELASGHGTRPTSQPDSPTAAVSANMKMLYGEEYTDLVISCRAKDWKCHKAVVFLRCARLKRVSQASLDGIIEMDSENVTVEALLVWLYTLDIGQVKQTINEHSSDEFNIIMDLVELSSTLDLPQLSAAVAESVGELFRPLVQKIADRQDPTGAADENFQRKMAFEEIEELNRALRRLYPFSEDDDEDAKEREQKAFAPARQEVVPHLAREARWLVDHRLIAGVVDDTAALGADFFRFIGAQQKENKFLGWGGR